MNIPLDESDLVTLAQQGGLEAFNILILRYQDFLFRLALRTINDEDRAADAVQEACLKAFEKLATFQGESLRNWLGRIVMNACYDEMRRIYRRPIWSLTSSFHEKDEPESAHWLADNSANPELQLEITELDRTIQTCLTTLPAHSRAILMLIDMEELSYRDAAQLLEIPVGTIKSRLARARAQMRVALCSRPEALPMQYVRLAECP